MLNSTTCKFVPVTVRLLLARDGNHEAVVPGRDGAGGVVDDVILWLVGLIVLLHLDIDPIKCYSGLIKLINE